MKNTICLTENCTNPNLSPSWCKRECPTTNFPAVSPFGNMKVWYVRGDVDQLGKNRWTKIHKLTQNHGHFQVLCQGCVLRGLLQQTRSPGGAHHYYHCNTTIWVVDHYHEQTDERTKKHIEEQTGKWFTYSIVNSSKWIPKCYSK